MLLCSYKRSWQRQFTQFLFLLSGVLTLQAACALEPKAGAVSAQAECRFYGTFEQKKTVSGLTEPVLSQGRFLYDCEQGVIWATEQPVRDVLVLLGGQQQQKSRAYRLFDAKVEALKSRQSRFLTEFIMNLMSGDQALLDAQFKQQVGANGTVLLLPKKRNIRRAIQSVEINTKAAERIDITMTDKHDQRTVIHVLKNTNGAVVSCDVKVNDAQACEYLYGTPENSQSVSN